MSLIVNCVVSPSRFTKKTPYAKPIPKTFQAAWNAAGGLDEEMEDGNSAVSTRAKPQGLVPTDIMNTGTMQIGLWRHILHRSFRVIKNCLE